jgi:hypothetical protein
MRNRIAILFALQLFIGHMGLAQTQQRIVPAWKVGDEVTILEKGQSKMLMFGLDIPLEVNSELTLKVKSKNTAGYVIEVYNLNFLNMTAGEGPMGSLVKELSATMEETLKKAKNMKLIVKISPVGKIEDLENWQEVKLLMVEMTTGMAKSMAKKYTIPKVKMDSLLQVHLQKIDTKEEIMQETLESLEYVLSGYNVPFLLKGNLDVSALIFSKMNYFELNQKGLPATLKTRMELKNATRTRIYYDVIYSRKELMEQVKRNSKLTDKDDKTLDSLKIEENRSFEFDITSSWPTKIKMNVSLMLEGVVNIKTSTEYILTKK